MAKARRQAAEWATLIEQWRQSGLSLPAFCQQHGLSRGTMQNWVYQPSLRHAIEQAKGQARPIDLPLPGSPPLPEPSSSFLPVRIAEPPRGATVSLHTGIEVVLQFGRRIAISPGFDAETLQRVLAVLEGRPC
jgi:transposase